MLLRRALAPLFVLLSAAAVTAAAPPARAQAELKIPFQQSKLGNGLTVILMEDHTVPKVAVNLTYLTGSRMEQPHRTGFAHLFEHLMFMGTRRAPPKMFDAWMEATGGSNNASTSEDRTEYHESGPPGDLDLFLWLEADRMRDLGPLMTLDKLNAQREVVRNERRQTHENVPYGKAEIRLPELLFPANHPYHHAVIGSHEDLEAATVEDVKQFFATWYDPANASIVVAGDFDPKAASAAIDRYFGSIPSRGKPKDPGAPGFDPNVSTLTGVVRDTMQDNVELARLDMAWQSPKHFAPGDAELDLVADVLAGGKASRLEQALVYEQKIAQSVEAMQESGTLVSRFVVSVMARPGVSLDKIEAAVDKELAKIRAEKVTDEELTRSKNGFESMFVRRLEGIEQRAMLLNTYWYELGDPGYVQKDLDRYRRATSEGLRDVAARVLDPNKRVVLRIVPRGEEKK